MSEKLDTYEEIIQNAYKPMTETVSTVLQYEKYLKGLFESMENEVDKIGENNNLSSEQKANMVSQLMLDMQSRLSFLNVELKVVMEEELCMAEIEGINDPEQAALDGAASKQPYEIPESVFSDGCKKEFYLLLANN